MKKADKIDALKKLLAFVKSKDFGNNKNGDGLCLAIDYLWRITSLSMGQADYLEGLIPKHKPLEYVWKRAKKAPRIKWINEQLKKLEKK